jgi:hypothetical protein
MESVRARHRHLVFQSHPASAFEQFSVPHHHVLVPKMLRMYTVWRPMFDKVHTVF